MVSHGDLTNTDKSKKNLFCLSSAKKMAISIVKSELTIKKLGFDYDHFEKMVQSEWQTKSKSNLYEIYRWFVATIAVVSCVVSLYTNLNEAPFRYYFLYFSRWGLTINMLVAVYGAILVTTWYHCADFESNFV